MIPAELMTERRWAGFYGDSRQFGKRKFSLVWSPTGKPVGRNHKQEPPAKAEARVEGSKRAILTVALYVAPHT